MSTAESSAAITAPAVAPSGAERAAPAPLSLQAIFDYVAPTFGLGFMFLMIAIYLMKFATDVLGMSAATMGTILFLGRGLWDAVADPIAGYLSDRTHTRLGRRRPWLLASVIPISLTFVLLWAPPRDASPGFLVAWMTAMVVLFYTASTVILIPHTALGAELTDSYHDRTRIFGGRHAVWTLGSFLAIAGFAALDRSKDVRATAIALAVGASVVTALLTLWTVWRLRERPEFQGRGATHPYAAFRDVWSNPHARLLLVVFGIESLGAATIAVLTLYVAQYVLKAPAIGPVAIAVYMLASVMFVPLWLPLSRRFGKKALWLASMVLTAVSFGAMIFLSEGTVTLLMVLAFAAGTAASCGAMMGPSIQADVIDWDEHATGQRKEGSYFAAWNFVFKVANGLTQGLTGFVLTFSGYVPNVEQTPQVKWTILALYGLFPMACYLLGAGLFARFRLDEAGYAEIRTQLDARR
jgi:GPH family glycoside/pentoside/hexuronide:cation symporter